MRWLIGIGIATLFLAGCADSSGADAARQFESKVAISVPYRLVSSSEQRAGGRKYVLAVKGELSRDSISVAGFEEVISARNNRDTVVMLRGPVWKSGFSGDCGMTFYPGTDGEAIDLAADEHAYYVRSDCVD